MKSILIALAVLALAGCASAPSNTDKLVDAQIAAASRPTFSLSCPPEGCVLGNLSYTDPRDRGQITLPSNGWDLGRDVVRAGKDIALGSAPWVAVGRVAVEGVRHAGGNTSGSYNSASSSQSERTDNITTSTASTSTEIADSYNTSDSTHAPTVVTQPAPIVVTP